MAARCAEPKQVQTMKLRFPLMFENSSTKLPIPTATEARTPKSDPKEENLRLRQNLALSYRLIDDHALNEGSCNHLTVMAPGMSSVGEVMLIAPGFVPEGGGVDWSMVQASGILGLGPEGQVLEGEGVPELSGACIHLGVRRSKPGAKVNFKLFNNKAN